MASNSNLFDSISRIFQRNGSQDSQVTVSKGKQRAPPSPTYYTGGLSRNASSLALNSERPRPSQVSWLTPTTGTPSPNRSVSPRSDHSASSHDDAEAATDDPTQQTPLAASRRIGGSESTHLRVVYLAESPGSAASLTPGKQSFPLDERPQFPTMRQRSMDSIPLTPDSTASHTPTAFLNRPLKRTISGGSTSTLRTVASLNAPSIPPVDVRPNFAASLGVTPGRRTNLSASTVPAVAPVPRQNITVSIIYEDSGSNTNSFITAPSVRISSTSSEVDLERGPDEDDRAVDEDEVYEEGEQEDLGEASNHFDDQGESYYDDRHEGTEHSHMSLPSGLYDIEMNPLQRSMMQTPATSSFLLPDQRSAHQHGARTDEHSVFDTMSRRSHTSELTAVEGAIQQRWRLGLSFGSFRSEQRDWKSDEESQRRVTSARVLFWLGFIAPWCWLLGGWYLSTDGEVKPDGQYLDTVQWKWPHRGKAKGVVKPAKEGNSKKTLSPFWRFHARAQETLPMSPVDNQSARSVRSVRSTRSIGEEKSEQIPSIDLWVRRCRIAATISGVLLCAAVIACIIVLAIRG